MQHLIRASEPRVCSYEELRGIFAEDVGCMHMSIRLRYATLDLSNGLLDSWPGRANIVLHHGPLCACASAVSVPDFSR